MPAHFRANPNIKDSYFDSFRPRAQSEKGRPDSAQHGSGPHRHSLSKPRQPVLPGPGSGSSHQLHPFLPFPFGHFTRQLKLPLLPCVALPFLPLPPERHSLRVCTPKPYACLSNSSQAAPALRNLPSTPRKKGGLQPGPPFRPRALLAASSSGLVRGRASRGDRVRGGVYWGTCSLRELRGARKMRTS